MQLTPKKSLGFGFSTAASMVLLAGICGAASAATIVPQVEGGQSAAQGQAPWNSVALIESSDSEGMFLCSGTLVAPNVVLTAGHCAVDLNLDRTDTAANYSVMTGSVTTIDNPFNDPDPGPDDQIVPGAGGTVSSVTQVVPDPEFSYNAGAGTADHDVALLQLSTTATAPVIQLATAADADLYGADSSVQIAGWGLTTPNGEYVPDNLQFGSSVLENQTWCAGSDSGFDAADQVCIYRANEGTCEGDSGGPLVATDAGGDYIEIGTTSYGPETNCSLTYDMNVSALSGWLSQEIGILSPLGATTDAASGVTGSSATLYGSLTQAGNDASYQFQYGTTHDYGSATPITTASAGDSEVPAIVTGLQPGTTYHYRLVVTDTNGPAAYGTDETFRTLGSASPSSESKVTKLHPIAGTYHGAISRYDRISLRLADGKLSKIRLHLAMRCTRTRQLSDFVLTPRGSHAVTANGFGFSRSFSRGRHVHYRITARFSTAATAAGTFRVTATHQRVGSCHSGTMRWTARI